MQACRPDGPQAWEARNTRAGSEGCLRSHWDALPSPGLLPRARRAGAGRALGSVPGQQHIPHKFSPTCCPTETREALGDPQGHASQPLHSREEPGDGYMTPRSPSPKWHGVGTWVPAEVPPGAPRQAPYPLASLTSGCLSQGRQTTVIAPQDTSLTLPLPTHFVTHQLFVDRLPSRVRNPGARTALTDFPSGRKLDGSQTIAGK